MTSKFDEKISRELIESVKFVLIDSSNGKVSQKYDSLVRTLIENVATRAKCYYALSNCVSYINQVYHLKLIEHIFSFNFFDTNEEIIVCYCELLRHLNASHGGFYLGRTFSHIVGFLKPVTGKYDEELVKKIEPYVHNLIRDLLKIPGSTHLLSLELSENFPYILEDTLTHAAYVRNLLIIIKNNKVLTESIFHIIIDRIIQIDVNIHLERTNEGEENQFEMDETNTDTTLNEQENKKFVIKLDTLLEMIIKFIAGCDSEHQDIIFTVLLQTFEKFILSTHKSKFTQFIIFYMCGLKELYLNECLEFLLRKLENQEYTLSKPSSILLSTAAYLGSLVARATFVKSDTILKILERLYWLMIKYVNLYGADFPDADRHGLFYSICQTYIYILCFKYRRICWTQYSLACITCLESILNSTINPLKFVKPDFLSEFCNICTDLKVLNDVEGIVSKNMNIKLPQKGFYGGENKLDSFFPFDPFILKNSFQHFSSYYQFFESAVTNSEEPFEYDDRSAELNTSQSISQDACGSLSEHSFFEATEEKENEYRFGNYGKLNNLAISYEMENLAASPLRDEFKPFYDVNLNEYL